MAGMFAENPRDAWESAGGGGKIPGPVTPGIIMPDPVCPPFGG